MPFPFVLGLTILATFFKSLSWKNNKVSIPKDSSLYQIFSSLNFFLTLSPVLGFSNMYSANKSFSYVCFIIPFAHGIYKSSIIYNIIVGGNYI